jgi:hypothetical protein
VRHRTAVALAAAAAAAAAALSGPAQARPAVREFAPAIHVDASAANQTGEPSIVVAADGTEYIVAPDAPGVRTPSALGANGAGGSLIWRSQDRGRTWSFLGSYDVPTGGGDTDIAVAPNGTLYASGLSYAACSTIGVSTDKGQTWLDDPLAGCGKLPVLNDREWTANYGNNVVNTVIGDSLQGNIDFIRSTITSPVVVPSTTIELYNGGDYQWPGTLSVDQRNGTSYVVWNTAGDPNNCDQTSGSGACTPTQASTKTRDKIYVSVVTADATSAPAPTVVANRAFDTYDSFVTDAVDSAGNVYVVWSERHPAQQQTWTMLSVSRNGGRSWSAPVKVGRTPATSVFPWVTAGDAGRIAVSYYGTTASGVSPQKVPAGARWSVYSSFSTDLGRTFTEYRTTPSMQKGPICTSGTGCPSGSRNVLDFFETAADPQGCLVTAYADNSAGGGAAIVSYVRQRSGPGLRASTSCR